MRAVVVASLLFSALVQAALAVYAWRRRQVRAARPLALAGVIGCVWALTYGLDLASDLLPVKLFWMQLRASFTIWSSLVILLVVFEHLELGHWLTRARRVALLFVPVFTIALIWTVPYHQLYRYDFDLLQLDSLVILTWRAGPAYWLALVYAYSLNALAAYHLLRSLASASQLQRRQTLTILAALLIPVVTDVSYNLGLSPIPKFNLTPHALVLSWLLLAYAVFRFRWLDLAPQARSHLVDLLPSGMLALDQHDRIIDFNPAAARILHLASTSLGRPVSQVLSQLAPSLLAQLNTTLLHQETLIRHPDGSKTYYDIESVPLLDLSNKPGGRLVLFHDITERKTVEQRLLQLTQAVDQSPTSVVITDLDGLIEYVNPQFTTLTGYTVAEAIGRSNNIVKSGHTPPEVYQDLWHTIQSGQVWRGELLNRKKNGDLYWELTVIAPVKDRDGRILNFIALKEDITAQKGAEDALLRSEAELRQANLQLEERLEQVSMLQTELRQQALHDPLTGLFNRRYLGEFLDRELQRAVRTGESLCLILLDIDHFKQVNDTYGHQAGDAYLQMLADMLSNEARQSDVLCRYGGEEFLLALPGAPLEVAARRAQELCSLLARSPLFYQGFEIRATLSLGVSCFPLHGVTVDALLSAADQALYHAKNNGRDQVVVWDRSFTQS